MAKQITPRAEGHSQGGVWGAHLDTSGLSMLSQGSNCRCRLGVHLQDLTEVDGGREL